MLSLLVTPPADAIHLGRGFKVLNDGIVVLVQAIITTRVCIYFQLINVRVRPIVLFPTGSRGTRLAATSDVKVCFFSGYICFSPYVAPVDVDAYMNGRYVSLQNRLL